ncbi:hypothetical protein QZH41_007187 [Actinostola sp. cb2023]|nr:hypothetical protein QZH41_007187 [Actinostola sp. cb2023]
MSSLPHRESFYVRLPSNVITTEHENTAWDYVVPLPYALNFTELDEWTVAVTSVFLPPLGKQNKFDNVFIYSNLVTGTLVGDAEVPLLCTVDMKAGTGEGVGLGGNVARTRTIDVLSLAGGLYRVDPSPVLNDEFGKTLWWCSIAVKRWWCYIFSRNAYPWENDVWCCPATLPKNCTLTIRGHTFTVRLPASLNYVPDDWEVGMVYMTMPTPEGRIEQLSPMRQIGVGQDQPF